MFYIIKMAVYSFIYPFLCFFDSFNGLREPMSMPKRAGSGVKSRATFSDHVVLGRFGINATQSALHKWLSDYSPSMRKMDGYILE
jgi:hypothetical protein